MQFPSPQEFGMYLGAVLDGVPPGQIPRIVGMAKAASTPAAIAIHQTVVRAAAAMMDASEFKYQAPTWHLKIASEQPEVEHLRELSDLIIRTIRNLDVTVKSATGLPDTALNTLKGGLYAAGLLAAGAGAAGGAGLWAVKNQLDKDDLSVKAKQEGADYYRKLTGNLNRTMRHKYRYSSAQPESGAERRRKMMTQRLVDAAKPQLAADLSTVTEPTPAAA